jgi:hypothetical protein
MEKFVGKFNLFLAICLLYVIPLKAQQSKIKIHISKEVNGEIKVFDGEYENEEQLQADQNYKDFVGDDDDLPTFHSSQSIDIQRMLDENGFSQFFNFGASPMYFDFDTLGGSSSLNGMQNHMRQMDQLFKSLGMNEAWLTDTLAIDDFEEASGLKTIRIESVNGDEFGKKGNVKMSEELNLLQLEYFPNPAAGKFRLRFKVDGQGELTVKVLDVAGKYVFVEHFDQFGGSYSNMIDLNSHESGLYLLEIIYDKKRLTRKIIVE